MGLPVTGWKNKKGTGEKDCKCGTWKKHWIKFSGKAWPDLCSVDGCEENPTLGAHVINPNVSGEKIVPMCDSCNKINESFTLKAKVGVVSANIAETCEKPNKDEKTINEMISELSKYC